MLPYSRNTALMFYLAAAASQGSPAAATAAAASATSLSSFLPQTRSAHRLADTEAAAAKVCRQPQLQLQRLLKQLGWPGACNPPCCLPSLLRCATVWAHPAVTFMALLPAAMQRERRKQRRAANRELRERVNSMHAFGWQCSKVGCLPAVRWCVRW